MLCRDASKPGRAATVDGGALAITRDHPRDHPRSPEITRDHPRSPEITRDHQRSPEITRDHQRSPEITRDHPRSPDDGVLRGPLSALGTFQTLPLLASYSPGALWTAVSTPQLARAMAGSAEAGAGLRRREGPRADAAAAKLLSEEAVPPSPHWAYTAPGLALCRASPCPVWAWRREGQPGPLATPSAWRRSPPAPAGAPPHISPCLPTSPHISPQVSLLLAPFLGGEHLRPLSATATLWSDASAADSLHHPHECVSLPAWRLAIAGEFVKEAASPLEAAALSGLAAGEAVAAAL